VRPCVRVHVAEREREREREAEISEKTTRRSSRGDRPTPNEGIYFLLLADFFPTKCLRRFPAERCHEDRAKTLRITDTSSASSVTLCTCPASLVYICSDGPRKKFGLTYDRLVEAHKSNDACVNPRFARSGGSGGLGG
jgi:hypothetical protein